MNELTQKISAKVDLYKDEMIDLQRMLIPIQAVGPENGGIGECKKAEAVEKFIKDIFDEVRLIKSPDESVECGYRPNLVARMPGEDTGRTLWVMAHLDVVPASPEKDWTTPPFEAVVKDGKVYGRGSEDNNQGIVSSIFCAKALKDMGVKPSYSLGALFVSDEEYSSDHGIKYLLKEHKDLFGPNDMVIVPDGGNSDGTWLEIAEKSVFWLKVTVTGKSTHASMPQNGVNAHRASANLVCRMDSLYKIFAERDELFDPPYSTFEPTLKTSGVSNINTIPGEDIVYFDCRVLPSIDPKAFVSKIEGIFKEIEKEFGVQIKYETPSFDIASEKTPTDSPLVKMISKSVKEVYGKELRPLGIGGQTVATFLRGAGLHCVVYSKLDEIAHQPNEYCWIANMIGDTKVFTLTALQKI